MITRFLTFSQQRVNGDSAKKLIFSLRDQIGKDEFRHFNIIDDHELKFNYIAIEGKVDVNSVLFYLKAEVMIHDDKLRIKYKTNAPMVFSKKVIMNLENYFENNI
jgi:hypothetical protein